MRQRQSNSPHNFLACAMLHAKSWCLFVCRLCTLPGKDGPGCTTPTPPACRLDVGSGAGELAKLSADKACVVIGVLGG